jgi:hypothetical protein
MSRRRQPETPPKRSLEDYLDPRQEAYLSREFSAVGEQLQAVRWHLRLAPYPLDGDTEEAVRGIIANQVVRWGVVQVYVEEWA